MDAKRFLSNAIIEQEAIREGHFHYWKDYHSRFRVDFGRLLQNVNFTAKLASLMYEPVRTEGATAILTPNPAEGFVLAHRIAAKFNARLYRAQRQGGNLTLPESARITASDRVLIVDDGINSGNSVQQCLTHVLETGAQICGICVAVSRYPGDLNDIGAPVCSIVDLSSVYPLRSLEEGCEECDRFSELERRLRIEPAVAHDSDIMREKMKLILRSAYAEV